MIEGTELPQIQPEKWRRYIFETKEKYYIVILQQDLFHEWSIIKMYGSKKDKKGNIKIEGCNSYEEGLDKIEKIKKVRKARKYSFKKVETSKLGINYKKISELAFKIV